MRVGKIPSNIIDFSKPIDYEDIIPFLNPVRSKDLEFILNLTVPKHRVDVSLAFAGLDKRYWFLSSGVLQDWDKDKYYAARWLDKHIKLPLGVAFRLAKVFGVKAELLFEYYMEGK